MPAAYSQDLREKAIKAVEAGRSVIDVSDSFGISRSTLSAWRKRFKETGDYPGLFHSKERFE